MLKYLIEKEFKQIFRHTFLPKLLVAMPLMVMLVLPWAANQEVKHIALCVVDNCHTALSERLVHKAVASGYFSLTALSGSYREAMEEMEAGNADMVLELPEGLERDMANGETGKVMISVNSVNGTKGLLGSSYMVPILSDFSSELREGQGAAGATSAGSVPSFKVVPHYKFNPRLDYKVFMVPAMMVMLLTLLAGFLPALNIVGEKEAGTIEQMNVTPTPKWAFVLAKLIPYWLIGFGILTLCMGIGACVYSIVPSGSLFTIYLFAFLYIIVVSGMGLVISNYSETMQQAMFVMFFFIMIFLLMSGLFTPVESMPEWAQTVTVVNPLKYFIEVMRLVYLKGSAFAELSDRFLALVLFAVVFNVWAVLSYKKSS